MAPTGERVRLALYSPGCLPGYHLPFYAAASTNIFERHGLEVEFFDPEGGLGTVQAVGADRYDACVTSVTHFLKAKSADPSLRARFAMVIAQRPHHAAYAAVRGTDGNGPSIRRFEDLEDATFLGTPDSGFGREYLSLLASLGLRAGRSRESSSGELKGLCRGEGDVTVEFLDVAPRFAAAAQRAGRELVALPFYEAGLDVYGSGLVVSDALLTSRPEVASRLVEALRASLVATLDDPLTGFTALRRRLPGVSTAQAKDGWDASSRLIFHHGDLATMTLEKWERTVEHHVLVHCTDSFSPDDIFTSALG